MGVRSGGKGTVTPLDFHIDIDKVENGLMVVFFGLVFFRCHPSPPPA